MTKKFSIFYILLCINLCSITVLSAFNYLVFHNMNSKAYLESFTDYNKQVMDLAFHNIDSQIIESVMEIPSLYFSSIKGNEPIRRPQSESISASPAEISALVERLQELPLIYPYLKSMDIYYEGTNTIVTGFHNVHYVQNEQEINYFLPWYFEFEKKNTNQYFFDVSDSVYPTGEPVLTYVKKISQLNWKSRDILIAFHISPAKFGEYVDETKGNLVIAADGDRVLYDSSGPDSEFAGAILRHIDSEPERFSKDNEPFLLKHGGEQIMVFHKAFPLTGLNYFYYMRNNSFLADYNIKNQIFRWNFIISIGFNLLVLVAVSCLNYFVYKKRVLIFSKEAGMSIKDNNSSLDNSLTALAERITDLNKTVKSSESVMFQNSLRSLILDRKIAGAYESLFSDCRFDSLCCFIIYLKEQDCDNISPEYLQNEFPPDNPVYRIMLTALERGELIAVAVFNRTDYETAYHEFEQKLLLRLEDYELVTGAVYDLKKENIRESFKSADEVARYRFIFTENRILHYDDIGIEKMKSSGSHLKLFAAIENDIHNESILDFKYHVDALVVSFKSGNYTIDYCMMTLRDLVTVLYREVQHSQFDMWIIYGYDIREYYKQITTIDEFRDWVDSLCEVLLQNIRQNKRPEDADIKKRLMDMIDANLENNISLDFLSDQFSMRPDVLSRMFKQLIGENYTEYIKGKKLKRAVELIEEGHSMKDIANRLGYNSPQYFIKIFKEAYGMTPYQYKKHRMTDESDSK